MQSDKERIEEAFRIAHNGLHEIIYVIQNIWITELVSKAELTEFVIDIQNQLKKQKKKFLKENNL